MDTLRHQRVEWAFAAMAGLSGGCHCGSFCGRFSCPFERRVLRRHSPIGDDFLTGWLDHGGLNQGGMYHRSLCGYTHITCKFLLDDESVRRVDVH